MTFEFAVFGNGLPPIAIIDGVRLNIISMTYGWCTKTEEVGSGDNICIVDGYFDGSIVLKRFINNIKLGTIEEVPIENEFSEPMGRIFEVLEIGSNPEKWTKISALKLKIGDIFRIKDNGRYHRDLDGTGIWSVTDIGDLSNGNIKAKPYPTKIPE